MLKLSSAAIEAIGFGRFGPERAIRATFYSTHIFQVQGLNVDAGCVLSLTGKVAEAQYRAALGSGINMIARSLLDDEYVPSEAAWEEELKCRPPYLMVVIGPTSPHDCLEGYVKEEADA